MLTFNDQGMTFIDRDSDERFRKALLDGVPPSLRSKMREALAVTPDPHRDYAHSCRYFGDELQTIGERIKPLSVALDRRFPGLCDWLIMTGYTNNYKMVKVFDAWAHMKASNG